MGSRSIALGSFEVTPLEMTNAFATLAAGDAEILAVTARPGVISFAGGLPAPELFDVEGIAASFAAVLADGGQRALQYSTTENAVNAAEKTEAVSA